MASSCYSSITEFVESLNSTSSRSKLSSAVLPTTLNCIFQISKELRAAHHVSQAGTANAFGDDQLNVDVLAEGIIRSEAARCPSIVTLSSEEDPVETRVQHEVDTNNETEIYTLAFDPLDGSSIIAPNWTVGTIIGIWEGDTALNQPTSKQIAAVLGVYGPRTTAIIAIRLPEGQPVCFEVGLTNAAGTSPACEIIRKRITLDNPPFKTRYFAPANLRAAAEDKAYLELINHFITEKYTLRYSGGLVPDILHILVKGHGIYISPVTVSSKAKLRRLFELAPIALVMECAGAKAIDPITGKDVLDQSIIDCDERAGLICGTADEIDKVKRFLRLE